MATVHDGAAARRRLRERRHDAPAPLCAGRPAPRRARALHQILYLLSVVSPLLLSAVASAAAGGPTPTVLWSHTVDTSEQVVVLTYATGMPRHPPTARRFCAFLESLGQHEIVANALGWDTEWQERFAPRVDILREVTSRLPVNVTVVWTDAFDVLFVDDVTAIYRCTRARPPLIDMGGCPWSLQE